MKMKNLLLGILSVFLCCLFLVGCGGNTVKEEGRLTLANNIDAVGDLNPHTYLPNQFITLDMVYEGLVQYGEGGKIIPQVAASWDVSPDGKTYTFHIRKDVKFSDGSVLTAKTVERNFKTIFGPENKQSHSWFGLTNYIASFSAPNDNTFVLELTRPYSAALYDLAMIRPIRFVAEKSFPEGDNTAKGLKEPIGTGPWMLKKLVKNEYAVFVPNPYYWGVKPKLKEVVIKVIPDSETLALQFESGDIDMIYGNSLISLDRFKAYQKDSKYVTDVSQPMSTRMLLLNTNNKVTSDILVRRALEHAVDKKAISEHIFAGVEKPANTMFAPGTPYTDVGLTPYEYSPLDVELLLDKAGWLKNEEGKRVKDGKVLSLYFPYIASNLADKSIAEYLQSAWAQFGIDVEIKGLEKKQYWQEAQKGNFDVMFDFTWGAPWDPHAFLSSMTTDAEGGGPNYIAQQGLPNKAEIDASIKKALGEPDYNKLPEDYKEVLVTLHNAALYIPITHQAIEMVYRKGELNGVAFMPEENRLPVFTTETAK